MAMRRMSKLATDSPLYFDTDCLSAFLWVRDESLLTQLYPGRVVLPRQVYDELGAVPHLQARIDTLLSRNEVKISEIQVGTPAHEIYAELTGVPRPGHAVIGRGEAASLALSKCFNGIVASNNLRDISQYISEFGLQHKTTGDILAEAMDAGLISEQEGNTLWSNMLKKRRMLGAPSFTEFLRQKGC